VGDSIRARRKELGITLREVSIRSGLTEASISNIERGRPGSGSPVTLTKIAAALRCEPADLGITLEERVCDGCGEPLLQARPNHRFHNRRCKERAREAAERDAGGGAARGTLLTATCTRCGAPFEFAVHGRHRRVCFTCRPAAARPTGPRICARCGKAPTIEPRRRYCETCDIWVKAQIAAGRSATGEQRRRATPRICEVCSQPFDARDSAQRTCGRSCGWELRRRAHGGSNNASEGS
jgi:transcriptional regulator with XRE-family HTH domain